jgi:hypothetical protein
MMTVSDIDVFRSANQWVTRHGNRALAEARTMVDRFERAGDSDGADTWLRIIVAIQTIQAGPIGAIN